MELNTLLKIRKDSSTFREWELSAVCAQPAGDRFYSAVNVLRGDFRENERSSLSFSLFDFIKENRASGKKRNIRAARKVSRRSFGGFYDCCLYGFSFLSPLLHSFSFSSSSCCSFPPSRVLCSVPLPVIFLVLSFASSSLLRRRSSKRRIWTFGCRRSGDLNDTWIH